MEERMVERMVGKEKERASALAYGRLKDIYWGM